MINAPFGGGYGNILPPHTHGIWVHHGWSMMTVLNTLLAGWGSFAKKIIMKQFLSIILWLAWAGGGWCQSVWDLNHLRQVKQSVENPSYEEAFRALCRQAAISTTT